MKCFEMHTRTQYVYRNSARLPIHMSRTTYGGYQTKPKRRQGGEATQLEFFAK